MKHKDVKEKKPNLIKRIINLNKRTYFFLRDKIRKSIRMELMLAFSICLLAAVIVSSITNGIINNSNSNAEIDYSSGIESINSQAERISYDINSGNYSVNDTITIQRTIDNINNSDSQCKIYICDLEGKVLFKSKNALENNIDIYSTIKNASTLKKVEYEKTNYGTRNSTISQNDIYTAFYPSTLKDQRVYVIVNGVPEGSIVYDKDNFSFEAIIIGVFVFILLFYYITKKKMMYIEEISKGIIEISKGKLDYKVKIIGQDELSSLSGYINEMAHDLSVNIEEERKAERTKSELITNVSHDLRTPLTSIKGYLGLIMENKYKTEDELKNYVDIAFKKSEKLEKLINDLFEYTKLESSHVSLNKSKICLNELLDQLLFEMQPLCDEDGVTLNKTYLTDRAYVNIDGDKTVRVFENLFTNAMRYGKKPCTINLRVYESDDNIVTEVENPCENMSKEQLDRIFERFYRVENSRSEETGGSGLGLAIAKSIVTLQGGNLTASLKDDLIIFTVTLKKDIS